MSDTKIWGPCGHNWVDFACYAVGALDDEIEARTVEVQVVACAVCSDKLGDFLEVAGLIYEAKPPSQPGCNAGNGNRSEGCDPGNSFANNRGGDEIPSSGDIPNAGGNNVD